MKNNSIFFTSLLLTSLFSFSVQAEKAQSSSMSYSMPAVEVGFKSNTASVTGFTSDKQENGFQLGVSSVFDFAERFGVKSGLFYSERPFRAETSSTVGIKGKITYFEIPAFLMWKIEDYAGVYVGPSLSIKLGDEVSAGSLTDVKGLVTPITFGAQFKFVPNMGANVFFEAVPGDLATGISNSRAVGVNLMFTLD